jgi:phage terminase Nu1 subunit (DNA packaging protein)
VDNVVGIPLRREVTYLTRQELAQELRVGVRTVDRMRAEGMPCVTWGLRRVLFDRDKAIAWAMSRNKAA